MSRAKKQPGGAPTAADKRYLGALTLFPGLLVIRVPTGRGKTTQLALATRSLKRVLIIVARRALARSTTEDYVRLGNQVECYLDLPDGQITAKRIVICLDSLPRVALSEFDVVIIEESETTIGHIFGGTIPETDRGGRPGRARVFDKLRRVASSTLEAGGTVVAADAYASNLTRNSLMALSSRTARPVLMRTIKMRAGREGLKVYKYAKAKHALAVATRMIRAGKRVILHFTHRTQAAAFAKAARATVRLDGSCPRVKLYTSEEPEEVLSELGDVAEYWSATNCHVVAASPTLETGTNHDPDNDGDRFHATFLIADMVPGIGYTNMLQMVDRARNPTQIHAYIKDWNLGRAVERGEIADEIRVKAAAAMRECAGAHGFRVDAFRLQPDALTVIEIEVKRRQRLREKEASLQFYAWMRDKGATVVDADDPNDPDAAAATARARREEPEARADAIMEANLLCAEELERHQKKASATHALAASVEKSRLVEHFGSIDRELVKADRARKTTKRVTKLVAIGLLADNLADRRLADNIQAGVSGRQSVCGPGLVQIRAMWCAVIAGLGPDVAQALIRPLRVGWTGVQRAPTESLLPPMDGDVADFQEAGQIVADARWSGPLFDVQVLAARYKALLRVANVDESALPRHLRPASLARRPVQRLGEVLRQFGIRTSKKQEQRRIEGRVVRLKRFNVESWNRLIYLADRPNRKVRGLDVPDVLPASSASAAGPLLSHPSRSFSPNKDPEGCDSGEMVNAGATTQTGGAGMATSRPPIKVGGSQGEDRNAY